MRKETEKTKVRRAKSILVSSRYREDNNDRRVNTRKLRSSRTNRKTSSVEFFIRSNNLKELQPIISSPYIHENAEQIIKDIYPIIKDDISIFINKEITKETKPIDFLSWMMRCYTELYDEWEIVKTSKYIIRRFIDYDIEPIGYSVEIKFVKSIKDRILYELLIGAFSLLKKKNVPFWDNYSIEMTHDTIYSELEELLMEKERDESHIEYLEDGMKELSDMENLINEIKHNNMTYDEFVAIKNNFIKTTKYESLVNFFNYLEDFLKIDDNIFNYSLYFHSDVDEGNPIMPFEYAQISYCLDDSNAVGWNLNQYSTSNYNEYGALPFRSVVENEVENAMSDYPYKYIEMLNLALRIEQEL